MQIVRKDYSINFNPTPSTEITEFQTDEQSISGAIAKINGRYPESGYAMNEQSKELVYVTRGFGKIITRDKQENFEEGDVILIDSKEQYYWQGNFTIFMANSPKFDSKQHKIISE
jgi:mannose-6-phosphate isomerase-like protein (cupin superfamily)